MRSEEIEAKLKELVTEGEGVMRTQRQGYASDVVDDLSSRMWATNVLALLRSVYGTNGDHFVAAQPFAKSVFAASEAVQLLGVVKSALTSWQRGYVFDIARRAEAEVEGDLLTQAETLVTKYPRAAAVLAGAVLERHLRSICPAHGVDTHKDDGKPKTLEPLNVDLCKAGAYDGICQKKITYLGGIRNDAAHGGDFNEDAKSVGKMIRDVTDLCADLA